MLLVKGGQSIKACVYNQIILLSLQLNTLELTLKAALSSVKLTMCLTANELGEHVP